MDVWFVIVSILSGALVYLCGIYCWCRLDNIQMNFKNSKFYISWTLMTVIGGLINLFAPHSIKIFLIIMLLILINYNFFINTIDRCIVAVLLFEFLAMLGELISIIPIAIFFQDFINIPYNTMGVLCTNIGVSVLIYLSLKTAAPCKIYDFIIKAINNVKNNKLIVILLLTIVLSSVLMITSWINIPKIIMLITNTTLIIVYLTIIIALIYTIQKYNKIYSKYKVSLNSLQEYEKMIDKYKINSHENKNQLLSIRNMIKTKDKQSLNYIDKIIDNKIKDDEIIFDQTSKIPEGGLKATIYSEICKIKELKLKYVLEISKDVTAVDLMNIGEDTLLNLCTILGVFLDNAIDEVKTMNKKEQLIIIEMFMMDNGLCIDISNPYKGTIELDKISSKGYTTKGIGHGYGLTLVENILKSDKNINNEKAISKEKFTQRVIVNV